MSKFMSLPNRYIRFHQISEDDLETCEAALREFKFLVAHQGSSTIKEHFIMMEAAL
jgi:hypothetical protein